MYQEFFGELNSELAHKLLHTHYTPSKGDSLGRNRRQMANSAFVTRELTVCTCNACSKNGAHEPYNQINVNIKRLKMDAFAQVNTIRLKENHNHGREGIYVTLDGKPIEPSVDNICRQIKQTK